MCSCSQRLTAKLKCRGGNDWTGCVCGREREWEREGGRGREGEGRERESKEGREGRKGGGREGRREVGKER